MRSRVCYRFEFSFEVKISLNSRRPFSVDLKFSKMKLGSVCFLLVCIFSSNFAIFRGKSDDDENSSFKIRSSFDSLQFPYAVKIFSRENRDTLSGFSCSGSIVHHQWIITAGHCVYGFKVFDVFIGKVENDANHVVGASQVFLHPNYTFEPELMNDLALLKLKRSLNTLNNSKLEYTHDTFNDANMKSFSTAFEVVLMPQISHVPRTSLVGLHGIVAGYGRLGDCKCFISHQIST